MRRLLNRKPVSDEPVIVDGMPYRVLTRTRGRTPETSYVEAVDPYGNQVILRRSGDSYFMYDADYMPKSSLEAMRRANARAADRLDTDFGGSDARFPGGMNVHDSRGVLDSGTWYMRISDWRCSGASCRLSNAYNYVISEARAMQMRESAERDGGAENVYDPATGTEGFRMSVYDGRRKVWEVLECVRTSNASDWFARPPEPPKRPGTSKKSSGGRRR